MVVGHSAQSAPGAGVVKEGRQRGHQRGGNECRDQVLLVHQQAARENVFQQKHGLLGHAHVDLVNAGAKDGLAKAVQKVGDAQSCHQQGHALLVHQLFQHQLLDQPGDDHHDTQRQRKRQRVDENLALQTGDLGNPFGKTCHGQRGKQHHGALGKVEHARRLVNKHKAQGSKRIQHARHQATDNSFEEWAHIQWLVPR